MKMYPVVIYQEGKSAYGVTVPDMPGCYSAGQSLDAAIRNVQEAVEVHLHGEDLAPEPSSLDQWAIAPEFRDAKMVTLVPVDLSFLNDATVRVNITARKSELAIVDRAAKRANMDRSGYLIRAALEMARSAAPLQVHEPIAAYKVPKAGATGVKSARGSRKGKR